MIHGRWETGDCFEYYHDSCCVLSTIQSGPLFCVRTSFAICPQTILFVMGWWGLLLWWETDGIVIKVVLVDALLATKYCQTGDTFWNKQEDKARSSGEQLLLRFSLVSTPSSTCVYIFFYSRGITPYAVASWIGDGPRTDGLDPDRQSDLGWGWRASLDTGRGSATGEYKAYRPKQKDRRRAANRSGESHLSLWRLWCVRLLPVACLRGRDGECRAEPYLVHQYMYWYYTYLVVDKAGFWRWCTVYICWLWLVVAGRWAEMHGSCSLLRACCVSSSPLLILVLCTAASRTRIFLSTVYLRSYQ